LKTIFIQLWDKEIAMMKIKRPRENVWWRRKKNPFKYAADK